MSCKFCGRVIKNVGSLKSHELSCKSNPNKIKQLHSDDAGTKKGSKPWNTGKKIGRHKRFDIMFPLNAVLVEDSTYPRHSLKSRIIEDGLIEYTCSICGIGPIWQGLPMPLILDHINGINNDNRLDNLRFVCSNCDSQLPTYKSRNKRKRVVGDSMT